MILRRMDRMPRLRSGTRIRGLSWILSYRIYPQELQPGPKKPDQTDIQYAEAEKNRVKSVYEDFYKKYAARKALSVFIVENVSEYGRSNCQLVVGPKTERIGGTGFRRGGAYVGLFSELLLSRADALNVRKG